MYRIALRCTKCKELVVSNMTVAERGSVKGEGTIQMDCPACGRTTKTKPGDVEYILVG